MGKRIISTPHVVRLANREIKFRLVCGSVPGEYDLERCDSLAGCEIVARVRCIIDPFSYQALPRGAWAGLPVYYEQTLLGILVTAHETEKRNHAEI